MKLAHIRTIRETHTQTLTPDEVNQHLGVGAGRLIQQCDVQTDKERQKEAV